jgi:hypothetical protein
MKRPLGTAFRTAFSDSVKLAATLIEISSFG